MIGRVPRVTPSPCSRVAWSPCWSCWPSPDQATVTPYLVIPVLIGAVDRGRAGPAAGDRRGVRACCVATCGHRRSRSGTAQFAASGFTWLAAAVGIGLMGIALRRAMTTSDADASYRSAVGLIRRLEALSGKLSGGLDAVGIAEQVMDEADSVVPTRSAGGLRAVRQRRR